MKKNKYLLLVALPILLTGCTTYIPGSTYLEKVKARYEQNIIMENDPDLGWKICKHAIVDVSTLFFAEIWYANVRSSYKLVEKFNQEEDDRIKAEDKFKKTYIGKKRIEIIREFGLPDSTLDDGEGGRVMTYENAIDQSGILAPIYQHTMATNRNARHVRSTYVEQKRVWFALDGNQRVYAVGFRTKTDVRTMRIHHTIEKK